MLDSDGDILEIGRLYGGSTVLLLTVANGRHVTSIDLAPQHHPRVEPILRESEEKGILSLIVGDSRKYVSGPVGLLFIDGDHTYEGCAADVITHWPQLKSFSSAPALAVFHDVVPNDGRKYEGVGAHCPGCTEVCKRLVESGAARVRDTAGSMMIVEKLKELPEDLFAK